MDDEDDGSCSVLSTLCGLIESSYLHISI
jgi:hypothetical protein